MTAYLVLSHRRPEAVETLVARILDLTRQSVVVVHHDSEPSLLPWGGAPPERVHMLPPVRVRWGDWSVVEASLLLLRFARESAGADWAVFISGDDRPLVDLETWENELRSSGFDAVVSARPLNRRPAFGRRPKADDMNYVRYSYRWRALPAARNAITRRLYEGALSTSHLAQPLFKIEHAPRRERFFLGVPRRGGPPGGVTLYTGPQWMALGPRAVSAVLGADEKLVSWFKETWIPDQGFFHTVLYNDPVLLLRNERLTYVVSQRFARERKDWMVLRAEDFDDIASSGAVFARKVDPSIDAAVGRLIDDHLDCARARASSSER